jgi:hypothetical protein
MAWSIIYWEQGLGDTIQFCRYIPLLEKQGAQVFLDAQIPLRSLLAEHFNIVDPQNISKDQFDYRCPLMSLPHAFKTELNTIPDRTPYLSVPQNKADIWKRKLLNTQQLSGFKIGLVWSGSTTHANDRNRSISFNTLTPLFELNANFHCLQKEFRESDLKNIENFPQIKIWSDELLDFSDTAALASEMDLIISVDTSVAHLAGALGLPTWVLLPYAPDYRWMDYREDSPWYPSMRLFRQPLFDDWHSVIHNVVEMLKPLL